MDDLTTNPKTSCTNTHKYTNRQTKRHTQTNKQKILPAFILKTPPRKKYVQDRNSKCFISNRVDVVKEVAYIWEMPRGWLAIAKLKPLSLFIFLF